MPGEAGWFVANFGDEFSPATLSTYTHLVPGGSIPLQVSPNPFYLGLAFGLNYGGGNFGWGQFVNDSSGLRLLSSAFSFNNSGVYIGTLSQVPEPATWALVGISVAFFVGGRGKRHKKSPPVGGL